MSNNSKTLSANKGSDTSEARRDNGTAIKEIVGQREEGRYQRKSD